MAMLATATTSITNEEKAAVKDAMAFDGVLTELLNTKSAKPLSYATDIKFYHEDNENPEKSGYKTYEEISKKTEDGKYPNVTDKHIQKISITANGETRYFERIHKVDQTNDKEISEPNTGFKAISWLETNADGTPKPNAAGHPQIVRAFPGYDGSPLEGATAGETWGILAAKEYSIEGRNISPQTASMFAVGNAELYPPTQNVSAYLAAEQAALKARGIESADTHICGHSMGCATALTSAIINNTPMVINEPVAATLAVRKLREAFAGEDNSEEAQALVTQLQTAGINQNEFENRLEAVKENSVSIRTFTVDKNGEIHFTNSATMQTCADVNEQDAARCQNIQNFNPLGKKFNDVHPDNETFGKVYYVDVTNTGRVYVYSPAVMADAPHVLPNMIKASNDDAPIYKSLEEAKEAAKAQAQQNAPAAEHQTSVTKNLMESAEARTSFISSIHDQARLVDLDENFTYSVDERREFKKNLVEQGADFGHQKEQWRDAHVKGMEAIANATDKDAARKENRGAGDLNGDGLVNESEALTVASWMKDKTPQEQEKFKIALLDATKNEKYTYAESSNIQVPQTKTAPEANQLARK